MSQAPMIIDGLTARWGAALGKGMKAEDSLWGNDHPIIYSGFQFLMILSSSWAYRYLRKASDGSHSRKIRSTIRNYPRAM